MRPQIPVKIYQKREIISFSIKLLLFMSNLQQLSAQYKHKNNKTQRNFFLKLIETITASGHNIFHNAFNIECEKVYCCDTCKVPVSIPLPKNLSLNLLIGTRTFSENYHVYNLLQVQMQSKVTGQRCGRCNNFIKREKIQIKRCPDALVITLNRSFNGNKKIFAQLNVFDELSKL
jgi:hypothetical protein